MDAYQEAQVRIQELEHEKNLLDIELNKFKIELSNANAVLAKRAREADVLTRQVDELAKLRREAEARADNIASQWRERLRDTLVTALDEGHDEATIQWIADEFDITLKETYEVEVDVSLRGQVIVYVEATSEDDARRQVDDFDSDFDSDFESAFESAVNDMPASDFESEINSINRIVKQ